MINKNRLEKILEDNSKHIKKKERLYKVVLNNFKEAFKDIYKILIENVDDNYLTPRIEDRCKTKRELELNTSYNKDHKLELTKYTCLKEDLNCIHCYELETQYICTKRDVHEPHIFADYQELGED